MIEKIVKFISEAQFLKSKKREWRRLAGVEHPESVADHVCCTAQIWYILAKMEWADVGKVVSMLIWHDIGETRIGDIDKLWARYLLEKDSAEKNAVKEQFEGLPRADEMMKELEEYKKRETLEWSIAKDADYLECAFQAKKYYQIGHISTKNWIENVWVALKTESAKKLREQMCKDDTMRWEWLKKITKD